MKTNISFITAGVLALALIFGLTAAACSKADAQTSGGGGAASAKSSGETGNAKTGGKEAKETDFIYELNKAGDGVIITGYQKDAAGGDVVIPAKIEGYPVVAIILKNTVLSGLGFEDGLQYYDGKLGRPLTAAEIKAKGLRPAITSIVFPDSITEIRFDGYFFNANFHLKSIAFPKNMKEIPERFKGSDVLTSVKWPENLEIIGYGAFNDCGFTELVIPEGVKEIRDLAFAGCKNLTSVTIPGSIERIGAGAFAACPLLTTVNMPAKTIQYGEYAGGRWNPGHEGAFRGCPKLTGIAVRKAIQDTGYKAEWF